MERQNNLNQFRQRWQEELSSKSVSKNQQKNDDDNSNKERLKEDPKTLPHVSPLVSLDKSTAHSNSLQHDKNIHNSKIFDNVSTASTLQYQPFSIVGNLLNQEFETEGKISETQKGNESMDRTTSYSQNVAKRRRENIEKGKVKKFKLTSLKDIFCERKVEVVSEERLLDKLIADIDEITEIPFFDISIPREVAVKIFQYLDMRDLCQCAKVSLSWRSLSEDELLWCRLCHRLGQEMIYTTREKTNWKSIVQHNIERQRLLVTNWKGRIGKLDQLEYAKGKLLCEVHSCGDVVVAGYTNGDVKLWDLTTGDSCVYQPSSTSLVVGQGDEDMQPNIVHKLVTSSCITAASYTQGNVDIWDLESGTQPIQTYTPDPDRLFSTPELCLSQDGISLCLNYGPFVEILHRNTNQGEYNMVHKMNNETRVVCARMYENGDRVPAVIFSSDFSVKLYTSAQSEVIGSESHMTEIHNMIGASVNSFDFKTEESLLCVGVGSFYNEGYKIKLYDIKTSRLVNTLHGQNWMISCMNMRDSPTNELLIGSSDRKIYVYDIRTTSPVQTFTGHTGTITSVQMDEWKVVSGATNGFVSVWDRRMGAKLWEWHNRHPVKYCHFHDKRLIVGNISNDKFPRTDEFDNINHRRYRGSVNTYNFLEDLTTRDVPEICLSTYDQPEASRYNIGLAMPYDTLTF